MDADLEKRITKLEKSIESEERIGRFERRAIRIGGVLIALLTILVILLNKLDDVVQAAMRMEVIFSDIDYTSTVSVVRPILRK